MTSFCERLVNTVSKDKRLEPDVRRPSRGNAFIPPAQRTNVVGLGLPWESVVSSLWHE